MHIFSLDSQQACEISSINLFFCIFGLLISKEPTEAEDGQLVEELVLEPRPLTSDFMAIQ